MKSLIVAGLMAIALTGCTPKDKGPSAEYESLLKINSTLEAGTVMDYQKAILEAQVTIDQIQDAERKATYEAILLDHKLAYGIAKCPDWECEVYAIAAVKENTDIPLGLPKDEDAREVLATLWDRTANATSELPANGLE